MFSAKFSCSNHGFGCIHSATVFTKAAVVYFFIRAQQPRYNLCNNHQSRGLNDKRVGILNSIFAFATLFLYIPWALQLRLFGGSTTLFSWTSMGIWIMVRIHAVQVVKRAPIAIGLRYDITDIIIYAWLKMSFSFSTFLQNSSSIDYEPVFLVLRV